MIRKRLAVLSHTIDEKKNVYLIMPAYIIIIHIRLNLVAVFFILPPTATKHHQLQNGVCVCVCKRNGFLHIVGNQISSS